MCCDDIAAVDERVINTEPEVPSHFPEAELHHAMRKIKASSLK